MKIYQASEQDLNQLQHIGISTYRQHFSQFWTEQGIQQFLAQDFSLAHLQQSLTDPNQIWLLMENENQICCGFAKLNLNHTQADLKIIGCELQKIYLLENAIGKNHAAQLMQSILQIAQQHKQPCIYLEVLKNNLRAQKFYEKFGFKDILDIPFSTDLYQIGMKIMRLEL